mmetsp:Transcript_15080/g.27662  ORF Transcript_15080/g.27662 Transcript_15080/m.27662 type:complete len:172 (+) Transcript_15080:25-540(+)
MDTTAHKKIDYSSPGVDTIDDPADGAIVYLEDKSPRPGDVGFSDDGFAPAAVSVTKQASSSKESFIATEEMESSEPFEFTVNITKGSSKLGVDAELDIANCRLLIVEVKDGAVQEWNKAHPDMEVRKGDHVVAVNGSRGQARHLVQAMRDSQELNLLVVRHGVKQIPAEQV